MTTIFKASALALATASMAIAPVPAAAKDHGYSRHDNGNHYGWDRGRGNRDRDGYYNRARYEDYNYRYQGRRYNERTYRGTRVWQDRDGRYYCQRKDGTTGMIIGGALGALLGREIDGGRDRTLGTILGAAGGALLGKSVAQDDCR